MVGVRQNQRYSGVWAALSLFTTLILYLHLQPVKDRLEKVQNGISTTKLATGSVYRQEQNFSFVYEPVAKLYNATALNNTGKASKHTLFFNRVPKVGSQTTSVLLEMLATQNNFIYQNEAPKRYSQIQVPETDEANLTFGLQMPIYMNFVRHPIDRVISWFYYVRAPWFIVERASYFPDLPLPNPAWLRKDFESCVLSGDRECSFIPGDLDGGMGDHQRQAMFFCGHQRSCRKFNSDWVIQQAKRNVEEHYAVVGVLEHFPFKFSKRTFQGSSQMHHRSTTNT